MMNAQPTVFNSAQLYLLDVFSRIKSDEELNDIKRIIGNYYAQKLDARSEANSPTDKGWTRSFAGLWKDDRTAEEIIEDIRASRNANINGVVL